MRDGKCEFECAVDEYSKGGACRKCEKNCVTCSDNMVCTTCKGGYVLTMYGECERGCPKGSYSEGQVCVKCQGRCTSCLGENVCVECMAGFKLK